MALGHQAMEIPLRNVKFKFTCDADKLKWIGRCGCVIAQLKQFVLQGITSGGCYQTDEAIAQFYTRSSVSIIFGCTP